MRDGTYMGHRFHTQINGVTTVVVVIEVEQTGPHAGKWACRRETGGRRLWRTRRQLRPIPAPADSGAGVPD